MQSNDERNIKTQSETDRDGSDRQSRRQILSRIEESEEEIGKKEKKRKRS